jgi:hypothetical protein
MGSGNQPVWPRELASAAVLLLRAVELADSVHRSPWDFAVEIDELRRFGLSRADLRWLVCQGFVEHAAELSAAPSRERTFATTGTLTFHRRTCFVLTDLGRSAARHLTCTSVSPTVATPASMVAKSSEGESQAISVSSHPCSLSDDRAPSAVANSLADHTDSGWVASGRASKPGLGALPDACEPASGDSGSLTEPFAPLTPVWDPNLSRLSLGDWVVKEYRTPAPNQQLILSVFQEEGWPPRIDDPLPPVPDLDPKRRLHETIISLNRHQRNRILRFSGDGHALGVRWEAIPIDGKSK